MYVVSISASMLEAFDNAQIPGPTSQDGTGEYGVCVLSLMLLRFFLIQSDPVHSSVFLEVYLSAEDKLGAFHFETLLKEEVDKEEKALK